MAVPDTAPASSADCHLYPDLLTAQGQKHRSTRVLRSDSSQKNTEHMQKRVVGPLEIQIDSLAWAYLLTTLANQSGA